MPRQQVSLIERVLYARTAEKQAARADRIISCCQDRGLEWTSNAANAFRKQLPWSSVVSNYDVFMAFLSLVAAIGVYVSFDLRGQLDSTDPDDTAYVQFAGAMLSIIYVTGLRQFSTLASGRRKTPSTTVDAVASVLEETTRDREYEFHSTPNSVRAKLQYLSKTLQRQKFRPRLRYFASVVLQWSRLVDSGEAAGQQQIAKNTLLFYGLYIDGDVDSIVKEFGVIEPRRTRALRALQRPIEIICFAACIAAVVVVMNKQGISDVLIIVVLLVFGWGWAKRLGIPFDEILARFRS